MGAVHILGDQGSLALQVQRTQDQARALARQHMAGLLRDIGDLFEGALAIEHGGDAYPAGVRQEARRLGCELTAASRTISAILERRP